MLVAFLVGGLVVLITGHDPIATYKAIFNGTGLNWFFPWISAEDRSVAAINLQQTLIQTTPLILTGLAVAFAFRCGLFNIGGQGQYIVGSILARLGRLVVRGHAGAPAHPARDPRRACSAARSGRASPALLKAFAGTNEVITTIMLNWIAIWVGVCLFNLGGPLQNANPAQKDVPVSNDIVAGAKLPVFWGDPELQGLHIGLFIALAALLVFWVLLNRTTLGYEVRAVGFNPDAAAASGISVRAQLHRRDGDLRRVRRPGRHARRARLAVPDRHQRHPAQPARVPRHRGRAARAQHGGRRAVLARCCSAR